MSNQPGATPPGFYPAEGGRRRYWDGKAWTDRYEDAQATAAPPAPPAEKGSGGPRRWWLLPTIAALFIGIGLGGVGKSDGTAGAASTSTVTATATVSKAGATVTTGPTVTAPPVTVTGPPVTVTPPPPPPAAPGTSVSDGVYVVGQDMQPGTYRVSTAAGADCYWSITKSGTNGGTIIKNDIPGGGFPQVTVAVGQDFSSARCGTW